MVFGFCLNVVLQTQLKDAIKSQLSNCALVLRTAMNMLRQMQAEALDACHLPWNIVRRVRGWQAGQNSATSVFWCKTWSTLAVCINFCCVNEAVAFIIHYDSVTKKIIRGRKRNRTVLQKPPSCPKGPIITNGHFTHQHFHNTESVSKKRKFTHQKSHSCPHPKNRCKDSCSVKLLQDSDLMSSCR